MPPEAEPAATEAAPSEAAPSEAAPPKPSAARAFYAQHRVAIWAAGLVLPVLVVLVGLAVRPDIFWDCFLYRDIWGSAVADATQRGVDSIASRGPCAAGGRVQATEDYTLLSEVVYGAIMAVALYGIYIHVLKRFDVKVDAWFVAAVLPFILYGPVSRTLEDTSMFCRPGGAGCDPSLFAYLFISPFLYGQIAVFVLLFIVVGALLDRSAAAHNTKSLLMAGLLFGAAALYGLVWATMRGEFTALAHPAVVFGSAALGLGLFHALGQRGVNGVNRSLAAGGVAFLLPGLWMIGTWVAGGAWSSTILGRLHLEAAPYVLGLPLLATLAVFAFGKLAGRKDARLAAYALPLNLGLVYGHMLDGFASFIAICSSPAAVCQGAMVFGLSLPAYGEKHPVSNALLGYLDGWLFPLIKLALVLVIVWVLDIEYRKDLEKDRNLGGLVKMAILILGLAPGLRDLLRLVMGT